MGSATLAALVAAAALLAAASWIYLRRELAVPGRGLLLGLRGAALALLALLLVAPELRIPGARHTVRWTLVDASASMSFTAPGDPAPASSVPAPDDGDVVLTFEAPSALAPSLRRAAEGGARSLTVYTDLRLADGPEALAEAERLGLGLDVVDVGAPLPSAGIARLDAPASGRGGDEVDIGIELFATAPVAGRRAVVRLHRVLNTGDTAMVAVDTVSLPRSGARLGIRTSQPLPTDPGSVVWRASVAAEGDAVPVDDVRHAVTRVDPLSGIVALVSVRPDWEPRWLLPVLAEATGLPTRGWLRTGDDAWLSMGDGRLFDTDSVARILEEARVAVVHGVGEEPPSWLRPTLDEAPRLVILPGPGPGLPGEWYLEPDTPARFSTLFEGLDLALLPPLRQVAAPPAADEGASALPVGQPGGGQGAALILREVPGERRIARVTARDFWRWAARGGDPAEAHRRLFAGVAGWLLELDDPAVDVVVGPERAVSPAAAELRWQLPPERAVELRVDGVGGAAVVVDTVRADARGEAVLPAPPVGVHRWRVAPIEGEGEWGGVLVVEEWSDELRWPRDALVLAGAPPAASTAGASGVPLRTTPWPWLAVIALLCAEWILRRRRGLR